MMNAVLKLFPEAKVRYSFILRSKVDFPENFAKRLREEIKEMEFLKMSSDEKFFFSEKCKYIDPSFFDFLEGYSYDSSEVGIIQEKGELKLTIEGYWFRVILWEVPLLALISELYFEMTGQNRIDYNSIVEKEHPVAALGRKSHFMRDQ